MTDDNNTGETRETIYLAKKFKKNSNGKYYESDIEAFTTSTAAMASLKSQQETGVVQTVTLHK